MPITGLYVFNDFFAIRTKVAKIKSHEKNYGCFQWRFVPGLSQQYFSAVYFALTFKYQTIAQMRKNMRITNVVITDVGPIQINRAKRKKFRLIKFVDLDDEQIEYTLCIMNGHPGASRFEKHAPGTRLSRVVVYTEGGRNYVDGNSNFSVMRAQPLF